MNATKIIALIPTYGERSYLENMLQWLSTSGQVDDIIVYKQEVPIGSAQARKNVVEIAYEKHGKGAIYLMLDDDCIFNENSNLRYAASLFSEDKTVGLISIPLSVTLVEDSQEEITSAYHCFMFKGDIISKGINYTPLEYADEFDFSLQVYLKGYKMLLTKRCAIYHHYGNPDKPEENNGSINIPLIREGKIKMKSCIMTKYKEYLDCPTFSMLGVDLPVFSSLKLNKKGVSLHNKNMYQIN